MAGREWRIVAYGCGAGLWRCGVGLGFAGQHAAIELVDDARHVGLGLVIRGDAVVLVDRGGAGVVGGEGESQIVVILGEQGVEIG